MNIISINDVNYKQYKNTQYYCDAKGNIYSNYSKKILKPLLRGEEKQYYYIDINFGQGQKHIPIHRIVYETWIGPIPKDKFVLHKDDNQFNNEINNLYLGTQKDNIEDCKNNNHRVGNMWILTVYDKQKKTTLTFCPAKDFIEYAGHPCKNGCINRFFSRNWFIQRYTIINYSRCMDRNIKEGVTTKNDECSSVGSALPRPEARDAYKCEEIV